MRTNNNGAYKPGMTSIAPTKGEGLALGPKARPDVGACWYDDSGYMQCLARCERGHQSRRGCRANSGVLSLMDSLG
jgi:hypothetical protein